MYTIGTDFIDSWTSLSELLQGDAPSWTDKNNPYYEIETMIEQNKLLKQIKERVSQNSKKDMDITCDTSLFNGSNDIKYPSTSIFGKDSGTFQKRINRSIQISNQKPIHKEQLSLCEYQKLKQKIQQYLTSYELSIFSNLIYELRTVRSCNKQLKNREYQLISKLTQNNNKIVQLQGQNQKQQKLINNLQANIKTKQQKLVAKQKNLSRFQVQNFLKEKMLIEKEKILSTKMMYLYQTEEVLKSQRKSINQIFENPLQNPQEKTNFQFINLFRREKEVLLSQQQQCKLQYNKIFELISQIQGLKIVQQKCITIQ